MKIQTAQLQKTTQIRQIKLGTGRELAENLQLHRWDYIIAGDGSATRIETPAGYGSILYARNDNSLKKFFGGLSHGTNNMAEMLAVLAPLLYLDHVLPAKKEKPIVYALSDSEYVVKIGNGEAKPKSNLALWHSIENVKTRVNLIFIHVNRMLLPANVFGDLTGNLIRKDFETLTKLLNAHDE